MAKYRVDTDGGSYIVETEDAPAAQPNPSTFDHVANFAKNFWGDLAQTGQGMIEAVKHPGQAIKGIGEAQDAVRLKAQDALKRGDYVEAARHALSYAIPVAGPAIDARGDQAQSGDVSGALGGAASIGMQMAASGVLKAKAPAIVPVVERGAEAVKAGVKAAAPDVKAGAVKAAAGLAVSEALPPGAIKTSARTLAVYPGARQVGAGLKKGVSAFRQKLNAATERLAAAESEAAPVTEASPGLKMAESRGISAAEYSALAPEERAMFENAAQQSARQPVGPRQPAPMPEAAPEPVPQGSGKTVADLVREELEAKRAAQQPQAPPEASPEMIGAHTPKPIPMRASAPVRPPLRQPEAPQISPKTTAPVDSKVNNPVSTTAENSPKPVENSPVSPTPLNPVEIGRRVMRSMGMEDVPAKDALQTFENLRELAARTNQPIEAVYQKYTGEPLSAVAESPAPAAPRPITPKQGEAAMFRTKDLSAEVNPNLDPNEARTFTNAAGEQKSKAIRAEEKKAFNADAKAKRFADAFHAEGITAEDVANMTAEDAKAMTDGLIAKGLLKKGEMPPNSSLPRMINHLKVLEREAKKAAPPKVESKAVKQTPARTEATAEYVAGPVSGSQRYMGAESIRAVEVDRFFVPFTNPTAKPGTGMRFALAETEGSNGARRFNAYRASARDIEHYPPDASALIRNGKIESVFVRPDWRGAGLFGQFMRALQEKGLTPAEGSPKSASYLAAEAKLTAKK
jgi:GNAT superfamily N-acetyltransferase